MARRVPGAAMAAALLLASLAGSAAAQRAGGDVKATRVDLAHMASGTYSGRIVPAGGPSAAPVRVTVARTGPNQVRVTSDHARLPAFTARLGRRADRIENVGGGAAFRLDLSTTPRILAVTVESASWTGSKE